MTGTHAKAGLAAAIAVLFLPASLAQGDARMELTPQKIAARVRKHRAAEVTLTVTGAAGKPLHFTETTILSGERKKQIRWHGPPYKDWPTTPEGEKRQAEQVAEFYTVLFSHPAVEAITWWDFSDRAWLGAPAGLVRKDMSPKPAYDRPMKLIKGKWWTAEQQLRTDSAGRVNFRGFLGDYEVESADAVGAFTVAKPPTAQAAVRLSKRKLG